MTLVNQAFDGAYGPLMHFLINDPNLTPKQRQALEEALKEQPEKQRETENGGDNQ
jgi:hypothetical protein